MAASPTSCGAWTCRACGTSGRCPRRSPAGAAAFVRWNVEHLFRVAKTEVGLTHFEGRSYVSLMRHLALCLVVLAFVALHTVRLRGGKPGGDGGASVPGLGMGVPRISAPTAG